MRVTRIAAVCFEILYQSRVSIAAASGFMAATSSRILAGAIDWRAVSIVAFCTWSAYGIDDFIDFTRDQERSHRNLNVNLRSVKLFASVCSASIAVLALKGRPSALAEFLLLCGLLTFAFSLVSSRIRRNIRLSHLWVGLRTVYVSLIWSLVAVLAPLLDLSRPIDYSAISSIAFIFILMLAVSALWAEGEHPERRESQRAIGAYDRLMLFSCALSGFLILSTSLRGIFPWQNISLLPACISNAMFVLFRHRFRKVDHRVLNEAMILTNLFTCLFALGAYAHPESVFGPRFALDWFQLGACAIFFGSIAIKSAALKTPDDNGGYLDFLLLLGIAFLGFQIIIASLHVQQWLFPALQRRLFASDPVADLGVLLTCVALVLQSTAYISMSSAWRLMATSTGTSELVTAGPFAFTRNPIYVSSEIYILGTFLINGTIVFALFLLIAPLLVHAQIRREEAFLSERFGTDYARYIKNTPRYVFV